ncbi:MAG: type IV pilus assembly protein PilM [Lentisphaerae bacterium]|nr:type IV pilus assembly protein PilM [Lentisphaerota bacterium]
MLRSRRILALDIGSSKVVLAEFALLKSGEIHLTDCGIGSLGFEPDTEGDVSAYIVSAIRDVMRARGMRPGHLMMTVSGHAVFPRFVKLPPVARDKVQQIVRYEAEQNVPFPIEEVVWDHQLVGDSQGEMNVILVAAKTESIKSLTDCVLAVDMEPEVVDVAPMALYNAVRYNCPEMTGCTMVLDIGARTSNLIFIESSRIFSRSIPVAGNTITQEIAKELDVPFAEAERLKIEHAVVGLGGVYAGPDNDTADLISKITRNVVTRLHAEVNRSINFYRGQQSGSSPNRVLLTGGSSVIPHMDTFFREKLKVDVEHFNPLARVPVGGRLVQQEVARDAHLLAQVVGLGLRKALKCPVEINLMPPDLVARKQMRKRQPFFVLSALGAALILLCWWAYTRQMTAVFRTRIENIETRISGMASVAGQLGRIQSEKAVVDKQMGFLLWLVESRGRWLQVLSALDACLLDGMWLTSVKPVDSGDGAVRRVKVTGVGFADKLKAAERADATAVEVLVERLKKSPEFGPGVEIKPVPLPAMGASSRDFEVVVDLVVPIVVQ